MPILVGEMVVLRPIRAQDADGMWDMCQDEEGRRLTGTVVQFTREQVELWCSSVAEHAAREDWAITHGSDEYLGEIVINSIDGHSMNANLRLSLRPGQRGRGFGGEAISLVLDYVFAPAPEGLGLHRVSLDVLSINPRARALYESLGFLEEGRSREAHRDGEHWCDVIDMGLLAEEWRASTSD